MTREEFNLNMTREEFRDKKSKDYRKYRETYGIKDPVYLDEIEDAYYQGMVDADNHPHWISVEDELPKEDVFVQVVCDDLVNIARRHKNRWQLGFCTKTANHLIYTPYNNNITHWMPLPAPPKKGGEE